MHLRCINGRWCSAGRQKKLLLLKLVIRMDKTAVFIDGGYIAMLTKFAFPSPDGIPRRLNFELLCKKI